MAKQNAVDHELNAINSILQALEGLDGEAIQRVLDYVFGRLSISTTRPVKSVSTLQSVAVPSNVSTPTRRPSIRDLKEEKQPESSNQMAALVAYYLSEVVANPERKEVINAADLEKYFKQAGFKLPKALPQTLPNATAAGYFDSAGSGLYRLNAVGYNLVVHGLPRTQSASPNRTSKIKKKVKKPSRK